MRNFCIITEDFCDLPDSYLKKNPITVLPTSFEVDEVIYSNDKTAENYLDTETFYKRLRDGGSPKTSALSMHTIKETVSAAFERGEDVLYISFSSGLSVTYNNARLAKQDLEEDYPDHQMLLIDSLCASLGQGLLVHYANEKRKVGATLEETYAYVLELQPKLCHYFTVDDLNFLHRGGRVSKTSAVVGSMLGIKPILHVDDAGKLIPIGKVRGRKGSLDNLVNKMESKTVGIENGIVFISHGDCLGDAKYVADQVKKRFGIKQFVINHVGPTIGAHSGPGTMALFFLGESR